MLKKLYICSVICFLLHFSLLFSWAQEKQTKKVSLSVMPNIKPVAFVNEFNEADGFFVRILQEIARIHDFEIEYHILPWAQGLKAVAEGKIDLQCGAIKTAERERYLDYTGEAVMTGWGQVRIHIDSDISTWLDLKDKRIGVMASDQNAISFKKIAEGFGLNCKYIEVESHKAIISLIESKEVDAGVLFNMTTIPSSLVKSSSIIFSPVGSYFVTAKGTNKEILDIISNQLKVWKKDKTSYYYQVVNEFLGTSYSVSKVLPVWVTYMLGIVLGFFVFLVVLILILKYIVDKKTKDLQDSRNRFSSIIENMPVMMDALDENGNVLEWNRECERVTGYSAKEIIGNQKVYEIFYPEAEYRKKIVRKIKEGVDDYRKLEYSLITKNKEEKIISWSNISHQCPVEGWHMWAIGVDITELKQIEEKLSLAKKAAELSDKKKTAFLASISHEVRTPMNGILGFANLLQDPDLLADEKDEYIKIIEKSGEKMLDIINDLVDVSKIEAGQIDLHIAPIDINKELNKLVEKFSPLALPKGIKIQISKDVSGGVIFLNADKDRIKQVFTKLFTNALKLTEDGEIVVGYEKKNDEVMFYVRDTGKGISDEIKDVIFDGFSQEDISYIKKYDSCRIGLYISKVLVEMHGGKMWVESEEGKGATFYFTIPL